MSDELSEMMAILVAYAAGVLSEGQASTLLDIDRIELRETIEGAKTLAREVWAKHRAANPVAEERAKP